MTTRQPPRQPGQLAEPVLDPAVGARFGELGYLVLPGFVSDSLVARLKPEVDTWVDTGLRAKSIASSLDPETLGPPPVLELELEAHGELITYAPLMSVIAELMGSDFAFHHMHSDRHGPDVPDKPWHHDYEASTTGSRTHLMIHALHYLDGLSAETSSLAVLPGSHRETGEKDARAHLGAAELPGEVVIKDLPPGSTVVLHSALFHARRSPPKPGRQPRYFVDCSYAQVGARWRPVKPHWRHILQRGRDLGLDRNWPELFSERHFVEYPTPASPATTSGTSTAA